MSHFKDGAVRHSYLFAQTVLLSLALTAGQGALAQPEPNIDPAVPLAGDMIQVNVNVADAATIADVLVGIGMSRARAIVQYREEHGAFKSLEDLTQVIGVGEATVANNKDRIRFE
jgi:competence protein ComEA